MRINFSLLLTQMVFIPHTYADDEMNDDSYDDLFCPVKISEIDAPEKVDQKYAIN